MSSAKRRPSSSIGSLAGSEKGSKLSTIESTHTILEITWLEKWKTHVENAIFNNVKDSCYQAISCIHDSENVGKNSLQSIQTQASKQGVDGEMKLICTTYSLLLLVDKLREDGLDLKELSNALVTLYSTIQSLAQMFDSKPAVTLKDWSNIKFKSGVYSKWNIWLESAHIRPDVFVWLLVGTAEDMEAQGLVGPEMALLKFAEMTVDTSPSVASWKEFITLWISKLRGDVPKQVLLNTDQLLRLSSSESRTTLLGNLTRRIWLKEATMLVDCGLNGTAEILCKLLLRISPKLQDQILIAFSKIYINIEKPEWAEKIALNMLNRSKSVDITTVASAVDVQVSILNHKGEYERALKLIYYILSLALDFKSNHALAVLSVLKIKKLELEHSLPNVPEISRMEQSWTECSNLCERLENLWETKKWVRALCSFFKIYDWRVRSSITSDEQWKQILLNMLNTFMEMERMLEKTRKTFNLTDLQPFLMDLRLCKSTVQLDIFRLYVNMDESQFEDRCNLPPAEKRVTEYLDSLAEDSAWTKIVNQARTNLSEFCVDAEKLGLFGEELAEIKDEVKQLEKRREKLDKVKQWHDWVTSPDENAEDGNLAKSGERIAA